MPGLRLASSVDGTVADYHAEDEPAVHTEEPKAEHQEEMEDVPLSPELPFQPSPEDDLGEWEQIESAALSGSMVEIITQPLPLNTKKEHEPLPVITEKLHKSLLQNGYGRTLALSPDLVRQGRKYEVQDLKDTRFPRKEIVLEDRRTEPYDVTVDRYVGVSLKALILDCGGLIAPSQHIGLHGKEDDNEEFTRIDLATSTVKTSDVLLAWERNGRPLVEKHQPLCALIPSGDHFRLLNRLHFIEPVPAPTQKENPGRAVIKSPRNGQTIGHRGTVRCSGLAYSGNGLKPYPIELSSDDRFSWHRVPADNVWLKGFGFGFVWEWEMHLPVPARGWVDLFVRCGDNKTSEEVWNVRNPGALERPVGEYADPKRILSLNRVVWDD